MKQILLIVLFTVFILSCFGQKLFFDQIKNSLWTSDSYYNDSTIRQATGMFLIKAGKVNYNTMLWSFKDSLSICEYDVRKGNINKVYFNYEFDTDNGLLKIILSKKEILEFELGKASQANMIYFERKKK